MPTTHSPFTSTLFDRIGRSFQLFFLCVAFAPLFATAHGTFHARLALLTEKISISPNDASLHFSLAELYCEHQEPARALTELDLVDALGRGDLAVDYLRGMCLHHLGKSSEALACLNSFVAAHPENSPARLQRARVHSALGETIASLDDYRAAIRLAPLLEPDLVQETADALAKNQQSEEAVQILDSALKTLGPVPSLMLRAVDLETATGRFEAALTRVDALQKIAPRPEPWMARRATVLAQAGRSHESRAAWLALRDHLAALPNLERGSHAMSLLAEQAQRALAQP